MNKKKRIEFDKDVWGAIASDPEYATEYFEELITRPLPLQVALLRRFLGMTQEGLAKSLHMKQTHISRLEKIDSDHLLSLYKKAAERLGAHLAIVPNNMVLIPKNYLRKIVGKNAEANA
jgi:DNA-binding XRE family transcriptional regulator